MNSYKDLIVWQRAIDLCVEIYKTTDLFPKTEQYGLTSQVRRCAVSIPSNIAEGQHRKGIGEFIQFLYISYGSAAELETQLLIAHKIGILSEVNYILLVDRLSEIIRMLNKLISSLKTDN